MTQVISGCVGAFVCALPGLIPTLYLEHGVAGQVAAEASRIQVFERLSHHLDIDAMASWHKYRFCILLVTWIVLAWHTSSNRGLRRVNLVVCGAIVIAAGGIFIHKGLEAYCQVHGRTTDQFHLIAAPFLRYYWYRMSDSLLPVGAALSCVECLRKYGRNHVQHARVLCAGVVAVVVWSWVEMVVIAHNAGIPRAVSQPLPNHVLLGATLAMSDDSYVADGEGYYNEGAVTHYKWYTDWQTVCKWIKSHTPNDALFLTPRHQQSFKWYAERAEVATWKDMPQDARSVVLWRRRLEEFYPKHMSRVSSEIQALDDAELLDKARKFRVQYILVDRSAFNRALPLRQCYPSSEDNVGCFVVYAVE